MLVQLLENLQIKLFLREGLLWFIFRIALVEEIFKLLSKVHAFFKFMEEWLSPSLMKWNLDSCD